MPKSQRTRIDETLGEIARMEAMGDLQLGSRGLTDRLTNLIAGLANADKDALNAALRRGDYTNRGPGVATRGAQRDRLQTLVNNEKTERALHRALVMVLTLKSSLPFNAALQTAIAAADEIHPGVGGAAVIPRLTERLAQEVHNLDAALDMVRMQVQELGFNGWDRTRRRPLRPGCAIGQRGTNGPGTLGCFVRRIDGSIYILSNLHVLKQAGIGQGEAEIIQPAHICGGSYTDVVADYTDGDATLDAAIARVRPGIEVTQEIEGPNGFSISGTALPYRYMLVKKHGCASGFRRGEISNAAPFSRDMPRAGFGLVNNLIEAERSATDVVNMGFQIAGDSGSVLCDHHGRVVGLMTMGGGNGLATGLATLIAPVLARFNVTILGTGVHIAP